jgi:DNA-binding MarR family transcriptional regulator
MTSYCEVNLTGENAALRWMTAPTIREICGISNSMPDALIDIMHDTSRILDLRILAYEYEIALCLIDFPFMTPNDLARYSSASHTAFYNTLQGLTSKRVVHSQLNDADRRSKIYSLDPEMRDLIVSQFEKYRNSRKDAFDDLDTKNPDIVILSEDVKSTQQIRHLTCHQQILLYLHFSPGITNNNFIDIVDVSTTKFNSSLRYLSDRGLIFSEKNPSDRRNKLYYLSDNTKAVLENMHQRVYRWLDAWHLRQNNPESCQQEIG